MWAASQWMALSLQTFKTMCQVYMFCIYFYVGLLVNNCENSILYIFINSFVNICKYLLQHTRAAAIQTILQRISNQTNQRTNSSCNKRLNISNCKWRLPSLQNAAATVRQPGHWQCPIIVVNKNDPPQRAKHRRHPPQRQSWRKAFSNTVYKIENITMCSCCSCTNTQPPPPPIHYRKVIHRQRQLHRTRPDHCRTYDRSYRT